jgi:hypothetical protein
MVKFDFEGKTQTWQEITRQFGGQAESGIPISPIRGS